MEEKEPSLLWELDPHQIFPWILTCRWFAGCAGCRLEEVEVCRWQGLRVATPMQ